MAKVAGFPVLGSINTFRFHLWEKSHEKTKPMSDRVGSWFCHKAVSIICVPANLTAASAGCAGMITTGCTLGALKIVIFAASLGNIKPQFSIGFNWLAERTILSLVDVIKNGSEVFFDLVDLVAQGYEGIRWVLVALRVDNLLRNLVVFIKDRIFKGIEKAAGDEKKLPEGELPTFLEKLEQATSTCKGDQPFATFVAHKLLSVINIPLQSTTAIVSGAIAVAGLVASCAKVGIYAATNIHIPIPTGVCCTASICVLSGYNTVENVADVVVGAAIGVYRVAEVLHITKAVVAVRDVIAYVPRAIFS